MKLYRTMRKAPQGQPVVGSGKCMLGARVGVDVHPDARGDVHPGGGLSVAPGDPAHLPAFLRPLRWGGNSGLPLFCIEDASIVSPLAYRPDRKPAPRHGMIEPEAAMPLDGYQAALAASAPAWTEVS